MTDQHPPAQSGAGQGLVIPAEVQAAFGELIGLIKASESMNDEERQYWINILPIMTPEQIGNLRDILESEKSQLQAIDEKYAKEVERLGQQESVRQTDSERQRARQKRQSTEQAHRTTEDAAADDLLKKIESA